MTRVQAIAISAVATLSLLGGMLGIVHRSAPAVAQTIVVQSSGQTPSLPTHALREEAD